MPEKYVNTSYSFLYFFIGISNSCIEVVFSSLTNINVRSEHSASKRSRKHVALEQEIDAVGWCFRIRNIPVWFWLVLALGTLMRMLLRTFDRK